MTARKATHNEILLLTQLLSIGLAEIRALGYEQGQPIEQMRELAAALHGLAGHMLQPDFDWAIQRTQFARYHAKYPPRLGGFDFVACYDDVVANGEANAEGWNARKYYRVS